MDGNKKFRSRALIVKAALRFVTKPRRKGSLSVESFECESFLSSASSLDSPNLSKDFYYHQEKYQKRKLSMSKIRKKMS